MNSSLPGNIARESETNAVCGPIDYDDPGARVMPRKATCGATRLARRHRAAIANRDGEGKPRRDKGRPGA
jgi:hypothetical protein